MAKPEKIEPLTWNEIGADTEATAAQSKRMAQEAKAKGIPLPKIEPTRGADERNLNSAATKLIHLAESFALFHDSSGDAYATAAIDGHYETVPIHSRAFRQRLSLDFYRSEGKAPPPQSLSSALPTIGAIAAFDGKEIEVDTRVAEREGEIWLDLGNRGWDAVRMTAKGWAVIRSHEIKFVRHAGMLSLPEPARGGSLRLLDPLVTLTGRDLLLLKGYLLGSLRKKGPFPILAILGEAGLGKTTLTRTVKGITDPSKAATRCLPKDERDLLIASQGQHILALDNLSYIDEQMSDALCRLATGGGLSTRTLYSDRDETIFDYQRLIILNAITEVLARPDLIDRAIFLTLSTLPQSVRKPETQFWSEFEAVHPALLGALCDGVSAALRGRVSSENAPDVRMADFALFIERGAVTLGLQGGSFIEAYRSNRVEANESAVDASLVAHPLRQFMEIRDLWTGTAGELLDVLSPLVSESVRKLKEWPKTPRGVSAAIRRIAPNLRPFGIVVNFDSREAGSGRRLVEISRAGPNTVTSVTPSQEKPTVAADSIENKTDGQNSDSLHARDGWEPNSVHVTVPEQTPNLTPAVISGRDAVEV